MKKEKIQTWLLFFCCSLLFVYIALRAARLSFTHDEALSFKLVEDGELLAYTANNHLLNTWLMALCSALFGKSELALRLPNLLACLLYLYFCSRLILKAEKPVLAFFAFPLLFFNPFMLDFFGLARGYGLSLGCMAGALYFFLRQDPGSNTFKAYRKDLLFSLLFAALALFANLSMINFYIALLFLFCLGYFALLRKGEGRGLSQVLTVTGLMLLALLPLLLSLKRLMILKEANDLYVGAESFSGSISTFIERSCYFEAYPVWFVELLQKIIVVVFPLGMIISLFRKKVGGDAFRLGALILLVLCGFWAEHYLFDTLFPISRTGVYFIALYGLFICCLFRQLLEHLSSTRQAVLVLGLVFISLPLGFHFFKTCNLRYSFEWKYDAHTKEVMQALAGKKAALHLGHNWIFGPSIHYYISSRELPVTAEKVEGAYSQDYVYEFREQFADPLWPAVLKYEDIGTALYKHPGN